MGETATPDDGVEIAEGNALVEGMRATDTPAGTVLRQLNGTRTKAMAIPSYQATNGTPNGKSLANAADVRENAESMEARDYFVRYLSKNVQTVKILKEMEEVIRDFKSCAPVMLVWKCVDGRVHGSKGKGYPIGTINFARTEGAKISINSENVRLWKIVNSVAEDAEKKTPGMPAVVLILGHYSKSDNHRSCAAHGCNDAQALDTVKQQADELRQEYYNPDNIEHYDRDSLFFIHGMTNTDDMSETLCFEHGERIDSGEIIEELGISHPSEVFSQEFLNDVIHDPLAKKYTKGLTVSQMLEGDEAPMYQDLSVSLAMEAFLMRHVSEFVSRNGKGAEEVLNKKVFETVMRKLDEVKDLPDSLKGPLLYQFIWNMAYALYQRKRMEGLKEDERKEHLDHAEELVCYGEGFETLPRNKAILVKPGRGNEIDTLTTAKNVLMRYSKMSHLPMVHINIELTDKISSWDSFRTNVHAEMRRMKMNANKVFGEKVRYLCTYSYRDEKKFYPIALNPRDGRECLKMNMTEGFTSDKSYAPENFSHAEFDYTRDMLRENKDNQNGYTA